MNDGFTLLHGDCLQRLSEIENESIDCVICDPPYGTSNNNWDCPINLNMLWREYKRVCRPNAPVLIFANDRLLADLIKSNPMMYHYSLVWNKKRASNFMNKREPLIMTEFITVFYSEPPIVFNPIFTPGGTPNHSTGRQTGKYVSDKYRNNYKKDFRLVNNRDGVKHPTNILSFGCSNNNKLHPAQKPLQLIEWLIKSYTNEGMTILDNCMGSGTTGVICKRLNRNFIGIEIDKKYFEIAVERIKNEQ